MTSNYRGPGSPRVSNLSRRDLMRAGGFAAGGAALSAISGCGFFSTEPKKDTGPVAGEDAKESLMLTEQVKAGKLPPLKQRLPENPLVVQPQSEVGRFGGTAQRGQIDPNADGMQYIGFASLVEWSPTTPPRPSPALAESWDVEDEGRTYVFHLRKGVKWSDGEPFTTDDLMYVYEHVFLNETLSPVFPVWLSTNGTPGRFVQVDEHTLRIEFADPHGLLLEYMCFCGTWNNGGLQYTLQPKHYMSQFHEDIAGKDEVKAMVKEAKNDSWADFYLEKRDHWKNPELPVLSPWKIERPSGTSGNTAEAVRNPYYWKVDPDGRQLPYIDRAMFTFLDGETLGLRAAAGDIDMAAWDLSFQSSPLLIENQKDNGYRFLRWKPDGLFHAVYLNMSHPDPVLRELFNDINFRAGFSHAINRSEIRDALFAGQGRIAHPCAQPEDPYFIDGMGQRFIEFDVDKANDYLDKAGLTKRDSEGMRLRPDGKPMKLLAQTFDIGVGVPMIDVLEFVSRFLGQVGIDMEPKQISSTLWYDGNGDVATGEFDILGYVPAGYLWDIDSLWYVPTNGLTYWAPKYGIWYGDKGSEFAMEPKGEIRQTQLLYDQLQAEADRDARIRVGQEILKLHDENVWIIGTVQSPFAPVVVSEDLGNVREDAVASYRTGYEMAMDPAQLYFRNPEEHT